MRRQDIQSEVWFNHEFSKEGIHENRSTNDLLKIMGSDFEKLHSKTDRSSIPPKRLLWTCLVQALYTGHNFRQQLELLSFCSLIRCLVDSNMTRTACDHSTFSTNQDRLLTEALDPQILQSPNICRQRLCSAIGRTFQLQFTVFSIG